MYQILGTTDLFTACDHCGRTELKGTVALANDDGEIIYMGTTCAARAISQQGRRTTAAKVRDTALAARREALAAAKEARERLTFYGIDADTDAPLTATQLHSAATRYADVHAVAMWAHRETTSGWERRVQNMVTACRAHVAMADMMTG